MSQGEMAKDESQAISESGLESFDVWMRAPPKGTIENTVGPPG